MTTTVGLAGYVAEVLGGVSPLRPLTMALLDAHGQILAEEVLAPGPLPAFDLATVDGYAVRAGDVAGATADRPVRLGVIGDVRAASWRPARVSPEACYAIEAGAPLPAGADAVVPGAATDGGLAVVCVRAAPAAGDGVLRAGEQVRSAEVLAGAGSRLDARLLALFAATGLATVSVRPRPRVAVLATGDELVDIGQVSAPGRVVDVNTYALTAAVREAGADGVGLGVAPDEAEVLRGLLSDHAPRTDLLLLTGGTGAGPHDEVRRLLGHGTVDFVELPVHPAVTLGVGTLEPSGTPVVCLPGGPAAALVGFEVLVRPLIGRLAGVEPPFRPSVRAALTEAVTSPTGLREFRPGRVTERRGGYRVEPLTGGSGLLTGYAAANGLLVLGERLANVPAGSTVDVLLFDRTR